MKHQIMDANPIISVLMPVHNGEKYLRPAIESILNQTFRDFEFLIINDGSTDNSKQLILSYNDPRIKFVENDKNLGIVETLNRGIDLADGKYIARMDCDDVSFSERLAKQVALMDQNPEIGVCGSWVETIGGYRKHIWRFPADSEEIRCRLIFENAMPHPGVMMRREFLKKYSLRYEKEYLYCEDYALWSRCAENFPLANIPEILLQYRLHAAQSMQKSLVRAGDFNESILRIVNKQFAFLGLALGENEVEAYLAIREIFRSEATKEGIENIDDLLRRILEANMKTKYYDQAALEKEVHERWFFVCQSSTHLGLWAYGKYFNSRELSNENLSKGTRLLFFLKCLLGFNRKKILDRVMFR